MASSCDGTADPAALDYSPLRQNNVVITYLRYGDMCIDLIVVTGFASKNVRRDG